MNTYILMRTLNLRAGTQPAIFNDIAQEAVNLCRQSLVTAADNLKSSNKASVIDAQLFLVRHLLILKEMTSNLDFASKDVDIKVDLTGVTGMLMFVSRCSLVLRRS